MEEEEEEEEKDEEVNGESQPEFEPFFSTRETYFSRTGAQFRCWPSIAGISFPANSVSCSPLDDHTRRVQNS